MAKVGSGGAAIVVAAGCVLATGAAMTSLRYGLDEAGLRVLVRATARIGALVFVLAYAASSLCRLWPHRLTKALLARRRGVGLAFALVLFTHLALIGALALRHPEPFFAELDPVTAYGGGAVALLVAAMALTSNDAAVQRLGRRRWRRLHALGMHATWFVFASSYGPRVLLESVAYAPFALLLLAALALRVGAGVATGRGSRRFEASVRQA